MLRNLNVKIFADGADLKEMLNLYANPLIRGLTTNPTLMAQAGIRNYELFARQVLEVVRDKPISFEVLSDDFVEMQRQALKIASWQENVYVKIPVTNTRGESSAPLIRRLTGTGVKVNVTAVLTTGQLARIVEVLEPSAPSVLSVFAGRVADTGIDPEPMVRECLALTRTVRGAELLWASVREVLNIFQADRCGCDIVTATRGILAKALDLGGMDLEALSRDTVRMFARDAECAGFAL